MPEESNYPKNPLVITDGSTAGILYVWHDCFILSSAGCCVIFDYYLDPVSETIENHSSGKPMFLNYIERDTPVYIVVSHHHKDHFNPSVFEWEKHFPNIKYILSRDTYLHSRHYVEPDSMYSGSKRVDFQKVFRIRPGETYEDTHLKICAYRSTDTGNAYSIEFKMNGLTAFHAGDLNAWTWRDESTDDEIEESVSDYKGAIEEISRDHNAFDLVMFPVDPRIGSYYYEGAEIFLKKFRTGVFIPMHYCLFQGEDEKKKFEALASDFEKYATDKCTDYRFMLPYDSFSF